LVAFLLSQIYVKAIPDITIISFLSIDHSLDSVRLVTRVLFVHTWSKLKPLNSTHIHIGWEKQV